MWSEEWRGKERLGLTWDQAQFERFSYILSNGYRWNWASLFVSPCPPKCYLQSETKIEPDLRLGLGRMMNLPTLPALVAGSHIWASEGSLARTRERAARGRGKDRLSKKSLVGFHVALDEGQIRLAPLAKRSTCSKSMERRACNDLSQNFICTLPRRREISLAEKWRSGNQSWLITGPRSRVLARPTSLAQIGELARRQVTTDVSDYPRSCIALLLYAANWSSLPRTSLHNIMISISPHI